MVSNTCETKQPYNAKQCICESKSVFYNYFPKCVSDHPGRLTYLFQFFPLSFEFALIFFRWLVPPFIYILHLVYYIFCIFEHIFYELSYLSQSDGFIVSSFKCVGTYVVCAIPNK